ncbi:ornithine cyclodeaminase [Novosphingobium sp. 11B]
MSGPGFRLVDLKELESVFDRRAIIHAIETGLIAHSRGEYWQSSPIHLTFEAGDCHVKSGFVPGGDTFLIKVATGFYGNASLGLANTGGLMLAMSQRTGNILALLCDEGMLTAWRTAAAVVLAARAALPVGVVHLGIVGAGLQAQLAAQWLKEEIAVTSTRIWNRSPENARALANRVGACAIDCIEEIGNCNLIVTVTPSTVPLVRQEWVMPGTHIVALGADTPGKVELDPTLFACAGAILTDDHGQCLEHGDFGAAVRSGVVSEAADRNLGEVLASGVSARTKPEEITIADLTGLSVQDHAIASLFLDRIATGFNQRRA